MQGCLIGNDTAAAAGQLKLLLYSLYVFMQGFLFPSIVTHAAVTFLILFAAKPTVNVLHSLV